MTGKRASTVYRCPPQRLQKWRVTLVVAAKVVNDDSPWTVTWSRDMLTQVVNAAPLRRRHWRQWQFTVPFGTPLQRRRVAPQKHVATTTREAGSFMACVRGSVGALALTERRHLTGVSGVSDRRLVRRFPPKRTAFSGSCGWRFATTSCVGVAGL